MPDARLLDFFDRHVSELILEKYGFDERTALRSFLESETYLMLADPETELYRETPHFLFDMWECEKVTGDPRKSQYLRG